MQCTGCRKTCCLLKFSCKMIRFIIQNAAQKEVVGATFDPIFKYGVVWVKYGVNTGSIRVGQTLGLPGKPRVSAYKYGFIRLKYGVYTGSIRVRFFKNSNPKFSTSKIKTSDSNNKTFDQINEELFHFQRIRKGLLSNLQEATPTSSAHSFLGKKGLYSSGILTYLQPLKYS